LQKQPFCSKYHYAVERKAPFYSSYSMFTFKNLNPCVLDTCQLYRMRLFS
jgi:hypothetical protein